MTASSQRAILARLVVPLLAVVGTGCVADEAPDFSALGIDAVVDDIDSVVVAIEVTPDGRLFYGTLDGRIAMVADSGPPVVLLELDVSRVGFEDGLLGVALAPNFPTSHHVFVHFVEPGPDGLPARSRIDRYTFDEAAVRLSDRTAVVPELPVHDDPDPTVRHQQFHFGGGMSFGPDEQLYLILGDSNHPELAQSPDSFAGSILRFTPDGSPSSDNPVPGSPVYATGIRNGFGMAWHPDHGILYATENGTDCDDELNIIEAGGNYGWGLHTWDQCPYPDGAEPPIYQWTPTVAPAGALFYSGRPLDQLSDKLLVCAHNMREIRLLTLDASGLEVLDEETLSVGGLTNLCEADLAEGPDGSVYSAADGSIWRISSQ